MTENLYRNKLFLVIIGVLTFISGLLISLIGFTLMSKVSGKRTTTISVSNSSAKNITPAPINKNNPEEGVYNVLLLGYGGGNHEGALLTDSIVVVHVDTKQRKASLISIPRDLWIPGDTKINAAGVNGFQNSSSAVQNVTGLAMNYYVAIDFANFKKLIDDLGGINVSVPETFDDPYYPIDGKENDTCGMSDEDILNLKNKYGQSGFELERQFTCRYEHLHFDGLKNVDLDGETALKFVRSRHGDSDFARSRRQFAVLKGIFDKLLNLRSVNKLEEALDTMFGMVKTDLSPGVIKSLAEVLGPWDLYKINQIQLTTQNVLKEGYASNGAYVLMPKEGGFNFGGIRDYIAANI